MGGFRSLHRRSLVHVAALVVVALSVLFGCGGAPRRAQLPAPVDSTTVDQGDVFEMHIVGEDKLPLTYTVASDGTVDLPFIKRVKVAGLEPQEIAELVRAKLVEGQFFTDPTVSIAVKEYNSKAVFVMGEVQKPGPYPLSRGMTLLDAITKAGGFNSLAARDRVTIRRKARDGATKATTISAQDIMDNKVPDVMLQAGDSINVQQRVF